MADQVNGQLPIDRLMAAAARAAAVRKAAQDASQAIYQERQSQQAPAPTLKP